MVNSLWPHELQHTWLPYYCYRPEFVQIHVHWINDAIQQSHPLLPPFSSCLQSFPALGSFPMNWLFTSGGHSIGISASSGLPVNIQGWFQNHHIRCYGRFCGLVLLNTDHDKLMKHLLGSGFLCDPMCTLAKCITKCIRAERSVKVQIQVSLKCSRGWVPWTESLATAIVSGNNSASHISAVRLLNIVLRSKWLFLCVKLPPAGQPVTQSS